MIYNENEFLRAISLSFRQYKQHGARSPEKLKPVHLYVANLLKSIWKGDFEIHYLSKDNKELTVDGKYYPKDIDISVTHNGTPIFCLGIKFVTSNYRQNANNYFENMMGETANIQARKDLPYAHLIVFRHKTPYYLKNETETPKKIEIINEKDLSKYLKLAFDTPQAHRPQIIGIHLIDINEKTLTAISVNLYEVFEKDFADLLENKVSLKKFFKEIENYKKFYKMQK
ncbi:MAG: hypothetical protein HY769_08245 [Candidatus Stahlbacteria bacterium]|nr:hypothetical protein [Candidatus Stahlbacteria bacterium]